MYRLLLVALTLESLLAPMQWLNAQSHSLVSPEHCVWHAGNNPQWADPNLDQTLWKPYTTWKLSPDQPELWVRCHAAAAMLENMRHPALQVSAYAGYQIFLNGKQIGASGNMRTGQYSQDATQTFAIASSYLATPSGKDNVIAAHAVYGYLPGSDPIQIFLGEQQSLGERHDALVLAGIKERLFFVIIFGIVALVGFMVFGLYLNDRSRLEFLLLAIACWCVSIFRLTEACAHIGVPFSSVTFWLLIAIGQASLFLIQPWFMFRLAGRPIPWFTRVAAVLGLLFPLEHVSAFLSASASLHLQAGFVPIYTKLGLCGILVSLSPFFAFWPLFRERTSASRRMRAVAICCMAWGTVDAIFFIGIFVADNTSSGAAFYQYWYVPLLELRVFTTVLAVIALLVLLFRSQRVVEQERALLAGEMQGAREIQGLLVNSTLQVAPGLRMEAVFRPASEVGGDFYRCRLLLDGTQRVLLGDVSGKGAAAAMTAAMLLGAAECHENDSPPALLSHLNDAFKHSGLGGFATCLCLDVRTDGQATFANAGQISPYRNGEELSCDPGLPLGVVEAVTYAEATLQLAYGDQLTLLSDGVLEARNASGELFGFDRTAAISTQSAEAIAHAAQAFGQEDDITVLTLTRLTTA
jgi:sigma-B regulation protein RsbU (phosphoserine phosphatase)